MYGVSPCAGVAQGAWLESGDGTWGRDCEREELHFMDLRAAMDGATRAGSRLSPPISSGWLRQQGSEKRLGQGDRFKEIRTGAPLGREAGETLRDDESNGVLCRVHRDLFRAERLLSVRKRGAQNLRSR